MPLLPRLEAGAASSRQIGEAGLRVSWPCVDGTERRVAVLFADIRGFTAFAEKLPPYDVIHALNRYFQRVEAIIRGRGGYVDNYMGDGLLAIFGAAAPESAPLDAVRAGLEMLEAVDRLRPYFQSVYGESLRIGVGIRNNFV